MINSLNLAGTAGVTMTGSGTLTLNSGGLIASTTGSITGGTLEGSASGELVVNTLQNLTIGSAIADNGGPTALVKTGSAALTLTTPSTFTGNIYLNQGTLAYALSNNMTYGGVISGVGSLSTSGNSVLTLNGQNTYSGSTTVSGGSLVVNGALGSGWTNVYSSGVLSGTGTVGNVHVWTGALAPGNSVGTGTLSVGNLTLENTGVLDYTVAAGGGGLSNFLNVAGLLTLPSASGGTLDLTGGTLAALGSYHLMSYGSLSGSPSGDHRHRLRPARRAVHHPAGRQLP